MADIENRQPQENNDDQKRGAGKTGAVLCIVGAILCLIGVGLICYTFFFKGDKPTVGNAVEVSSAVNSGEATKESEAPKESETSGSEESKDTETTESQTQDSQQVVEASSEESVEETGSAGTEELPAREDGELAAPSNCGALAVKGSQLVDQNGNPVQLRGISTHGIAWFPSFVDQNAFRQFRQEWNVNVMRLAMYTAEYGGYCEGGNTEDLKNIIYRGVQYATDQDMYVIIDWHILHDLTPNKYKDEAIDFFDGMSKKYKDNNNVIYEICNEPNGGTSWKDIKAYAEEVIPVIRANDPDAVILVGTPNWSQRVDEAAADPIKGYDNIMYTLHFYAGTHKDDLRKTMSDAIDDGLPVFVSEFGICDASGNGALDKTSAKAWVDLMNEYNVSYVCWALANKDESAALIKSSCSKTNNFTDSDLSESGKWLYQTLTGETTVGNAGGNASGGSDNKQPDKQEPPKQETTEFQSGGFDCEVSLNSKWDSDGKVNYQYNIKITNNGSEKVKSWAFDIHFSDNVEVESGWGGNYSANGNTLHVTNVDYNKTIKAGDTLGDLGCIISGPAGLEVTK